MKDSHPGSWDRQTLKAVPAAVLSIALAAPLFGKQEERDAASGEANRASYWVLLTLYGVGDPQSIAKANDLLDSALRATESEGIDIEDKFGHASAVTFYRLYGAQLPAPLRERARQDIVQRVKAIETDWYPRRLTNFSMGHTNFAMMYLEAFVLGSEAIGDPEAQQKAHEAFNEFCDYTLHNGFTEFNATNYYKFDLHTLGVLATESADPQIRRRAAVFAELLWFDIALHYWPSQGWLTGANARTYSYVGGIGGAVSLARSFFDEKAEPPRITPEERKKSPAQFWKAHPGEGGWVALFDYEPPAYIREIACEKVPTLYQGLWLAAEPDEFRRGQEGEDFEKFANGEFGHQYGKDRTTYIEPAYALGTGGAHYSGQDRMLVADIASPKDLASVCSQINTRVPLESQDDFLSILDNGGRHVHTGSAAVQDRNLAVILYSVTLPAESKGVGIVAPLLLLPSNVDAVYLNEQPADREAGVHPMSANDILYLQEGDVYACLRFVEAAEGFAGYSPTYNYRLDGKFRTEAKHGDSGKARTYPVGALSCVLYDGPKQVLSDQNVRAGFVVEMGTRREFPDLAEFRRHIQTGASISQRYESGVWEVSYRSGEREISLKKDLPRDLILDKRVNGTRVEPPMHATNFSDLKDGVLTVRWKGQEHTIDLRR